MDCRHDRRSSASKAKFVCSATLDAFHGESIAATPSECSTTASVLQLSIYGASQASSIEQESFHGRSPSESVLSIFNGNGSMGRSQDEAAALVQDTHERLRDVHLQQKRTEFS